MNGKVYLVGSGPGGTGLLAQHAAEVIEMADVIFYDQLPGKEILSPSRNMLKRLIAGNTGAGHTLEQQDIESLMVERAQKGKIIVRSKGWRSVLFGRGGEELETVREPVIAVVWDSGFPVHLRCRHRQVSRLRTGNMPRRLLYLPVTRTRQNPHRH